MRRSLSSTAQGFGIGVLTCTVGDRTPGLERILPELALGELPVWLTTHRELHSSRRIRVVFDVLAGILA